MRTIKFRAWDKEKREMREVAMLRWENGKLCRIAGYWPNTRDNGWTDFDPEEGKFELIQFTGLYDKSGKEICEGDVVEWKTPYFERIFTVEWSDKKCGFNIKPKYLDEMQVIGNILEDPKLSIKSTR